MLEIDWIKFFIGFLILLMVMPVHELSHYIPAKIMDLNPRFDVFKGKFRVTTHNNTNSNQVLIVGLMPIPFVAIVIFMALFLIVDYPSILNHRLLCLLLMIMLSIGSSLITSYQDIRIVWHVFN